MKNALTLLALMLLSLTSFAQEIEGENDEVMVVEQDEFVHYEDRSPFRLLDTLQGQIGVHLAATPFMTQLSFGGGLDVRMRYTNNLSAGLSSTVTGRKVKPAFGYVIGESRLLYFDLSIYNELDLVKRNGFDLAVRLNTGLAVFNLADNSIKEKYWWYDEYGIMYEGERALSIANNYFFRLAPSLVMRYKLAYNVAVEGSAGYNFFMGNAQFGERKDFNNFQLQLGVKVDL